MSPFRYRDEESSSTGTVLGVLLGAVAGFAVGMVVAQRVGGFSGLSKKLRRRGKAIAGNGAQPPQLHADESDDFDDIEDDDIETEAYDEELEDRVLEAFRNDPILSERAVDIGSIGDGVIELAGWVENESESQHAVTIARGVPEVDTVVKRIAIGDEERRFEEAAQRVRDGDPSLTETHWEGGGVGTGPQRQGNSGERGRRSTPKQPLEDKWQNADQAILNAADDTEALAERRSRAKKAGGVPRTDHADMPADLDGV